jgi:hypothetical protein
MEVLVGPAPNPRFEGTACKLRLQPSALRAPAAPQAKRNARTLSGEDLHLHFEIRTKPSPRRGLDGRISPMKIYGQPPKAKLVDDHRFI